MNEQFFETTKRFFIPENPIAKELIEKAKNLDELKTIILKHNIGLQGNGVTIFNEVQDGCLVLRNMQARLRTSIKTGSIRGG